MRTRGRKPPQQQPPPKKPSAADFLATPPPHTDNENDDSPKSSFEFHKTAASPILPKLSGRRKSTAVGTATKKKEKEKEKAKEDSSLSPLRSVSSVPELKEMVNSRLDGIKKHVDRSHSEVLKEAESSHSRLHKRLKIQTQACQQMMDETEKEFKKMSERITESCEAMRVSYAEFIVEAQTTVSRVCKTTIPEKQQSFEKTIDALRSRYGILSTPA